jgi:hypothetical protein
MNNIIFRAVPDDPFDPVYLCDELPEAPAADLGKSLDDEAAEQFLFSLEQANAPVPTEPAL